MGVDNLNLMQLIVCLLCLLATFHASVTTSNPNIVFILTDDQDVQLGGMTPLTNVKKLLADQGVTFNNMFTASPLCCPSRSSILTGNYVHNHAAFNNSISGNCSSTDWQNGPEKETFATHLQSLGYSTFFAGKYLNQYGDPSVGGYKHIPPGWNSFIGLIYNSVYYNYNLSVNGVLEEHGSDYHKDYLTDLINNQSMKFLDQHSADTSPFFMMLSTPACHSPFDSAPQYMSKFTDKKAPRDPSFNTHADDKHWLIKQATNPMTNDSMSYVDDAFQKRWRTLLSVDDMVKNLVDSLTKKNLLNKTFIFFSSDNGFHLGQFSLPNDKRQLYEFDIRVPLVVRGPGIPAGKTLDEPVMTIDLMPTFIHLAGDTPPSKVDGESLVPLLIPKSEGKNVPWRSDFLIEHTGEYCIKGVEGCPNTNYLHNCYPSCVCEDAYNNSYSCLRTISAKENIVFCQFSDKDNFQEFYNLSTDPHQLTNGISKLSPSYLDSLNDRLITLSLCKGPSCRPVKSRHGQHKGD